jgi:hypothetical protein
MGGNGVLGMELVMGSQQVLYGQYCRWICFGVKVGWIFLFRILINSMIYDGMEFGNYLREIYDNIYHWII